MTGPVPAPTVAPPPVTMSSSPVNPPSPALSAPTKQWTRPKLPSPVMNIEWDYNYYQPWSDNKQLVDEMLAMLDEDVMMQ